MDQSEACLPAAWTLWLFHASFSRKHCPRISLSFIVLSAPPLSCRGKRSYRIELHTRTSAHGTIIVRKRIGLTFLHINSHIPAPHHPARPRASALLVLCRSPDPFIQRRFYLKLPDFTCMLQAVLSCLSIRQSYCSLVKPAKLGAKLQAEISI